jgi:hypothetical protein
VYTTTSGYEHLHNLITLVSNCNVFVTTPEQEDDSDLIETIKVAKFYEMVFDKPAIGMPVHLADSSDYTAKTDKGIIETWPLI